ncbi:VWA domain-containing protein [Kroppenstedtia pulmonis]|uniref:VWA domain-containing protein n=1 Tax=Kroppenstedtia pulmonis TaxID=1380685 RepID=A0A7D3XKQ1_9BACL|nr:VWA domain-containing protein [Kroppenstedtia pulmonis]QKG83169.1 VWA domain-containing protein [Kroppenstedtia pulmonis]
MRFLKLFGLLGLILTLILPSACSPISSDSETSTEPKEETKQAEKVTKPATDVEGMLKEGPGKFAGKNYDKEKVEQALDQFPDNLSPEEAYKHLLPLLAEDYQPIVKKLDWFNTTFKLEGETPEGVKGPDGKSTEEGKPLHVSILLDASGSMAGRVDGRMKMDLAKATVERFASSLPEHAKVSLQVYGHKGSNAKKDKPVSCESVEVVYPLGEYQEKKFSQSLNQFQPTGWTPLAASMKRAKTDLEGAGEKDATNLIYIVSDGVETCGGDPVKEAKTLNKSDIQAVVNIIGFDVDDAGQRALKEAAKAGGGEYVTADSEQDLRRYFDSQHTKLWLEWSQWGAESWLDIEDQLLDKIERLKNLAEVGYPGFFKQIEQENKRLETAMDYLEDNSKVENHIRWGKRDLVYQRERKLTSYREKRYNTLEETLEKNSSELQRKIKEKESEMTKKYE